MKRTTTLVHGLLALLIPASALAGGLTLAAPAPPEALAFARYLASSQEPDPFTESGPVAVVIEASLSRLNKESRLLAIRLTGESERSEYHVLQSDGDAAVTCEVIAPYLAAQLQAEDLPLSSVLITPANYKFRYLGQVATAGAPAYAFRIVPKRKRDGLIRGELWIDSVTGVGVLQSGRLVKTSSAVIRQIELVRDTKTGGRPPQRPHHARGHRNAAVGTRLSDDHRVPSIRAGRG